MVAAGVTVMAAVVSVVLHKYEVPPEAVKVAGVPLHTVMAEGETEGVGLLFTVTLTEAEAVQVFASVTVTV